jgi:type II secretory pathway pseudopilin PulG
VLWNVAVTLVVLGVVLATLSPLARGPWEAARARATLSTLETVARAARLSADITGRWPSGAGDLQGRWIPASAGLQSAWGTPLTLEPAGVRLDIGVSIPGPRPGTDSAWLRPSGPGRYTLSVPPPGGHHRLRLERRRIGGSGG